MSAAWPPCGRPGPRSTARAPKPSTASMFRSPRAIVSRCSARRSRVLEVPGHTAGHIAYFTDALDPPVAVLWRYAVRLRLRATLRGNPGADAGLARPPGGTAGGDARVLRPRVHAGQHPFRARGRTRQHRPAAARPGRSGVAGTGRTDGTVDDRRWNSPQTRSCAAMYRVSETRQTHARAALPTGCAHSPQSGNGRTNSASPVVRLVPAQAVAYTAVPVRRRSRKMRIAPSLLSARARLRLRHGECGRACARRARIPLGIGHNPRGRPGGTLGRSDLTTFRLDVILEYMPELAPADSAAVADSSAGRTAPERPVAAHPRRLRDAGPGHKTRRPAHTLVRRDRSITSRA